ncbi:MAG: alpha-amylase domain-containing protein [Promethearchaeota archaeon]
MLFRKITVFTILLVLILGLISQPRPVSNFISFNNDHKHHIRLEFKISKYFDKEELVPIGEGVLLQGFYWDTPDHGVWWKTLTNLLPEFKETGFDAIWLPPSSKTREGETASNGYEPFDYYDLGEFNQQGRVRTRFGTRQELEDLIAAANSNGIGIVADIVMNHNVGGEPEYNPYTGTTTYTNFMNVASGKFPRNYSHFWPNEYGSGDNYQFANFPDLCHKHPYVRSELIKWGAWLRDEIGYDGWRFDVAAGIEPEMLRDWMRNNSGFGIAEYWYGTYNNLTDYLDAAEGTIAAFDFFLMYELRNMAIGKGFYDMRDLRHRGLLGDGRINQSITFVANHDTVRDDNVKIDKNKHMAYAFILTHEGYPSVFWQDYFDVNLQPHIKVLMKIHNQYAKGSTTVLHADNDLYIAQRNGDPGLIIALNDNTNFSRAISVQTKWKSTTLIDLTQQASDVEVNDNGEATLTVPPSSYAVWTEAEEPLTTYPLTHPDEPETKQEIENATITIDGNLDHEWGYPHYIDTLGDASYNRRDLTNLYLTHDEDNLYVGFAYGRNPYYQNIHYGIALNVRDGGSREDPWVHETIRWAGDHEPDYIIYLETDSSDNAWQEVNKATQFSYNPELEEWDNGTSLPSDNYASNNILGFTEIKIPLEDIDLENGGNLSIMVFSTVEGKPAAVDSIPHDRFTDGFGDEDSWLTLPEPIFINISTPQPTPFPILPVFLAITLLTIVTYLKTRKKRLTV